MRVRIAIGVLALGIIALLIWRMSCDEGKPVAPVAPVVTPADARPPDAPPVVTDAAPIVPAEAAGGGGSGGGERTRGHKKGAPAEKVAQATPALRSPPDAAAPPDAAPIAKKPDAEAEEGSPAMIARKKGTVVFRHHNAMGGSYHLLRIVDVLDGQPVFERNAPKGGSLDEPRDLESPPVRATLGQHTLAVRLEYTAATRGVFTYAEGYRFRVNSSYTFTVNPDRTTDVVIKGYEKGGVNTQLAERPAVEFQTQTIPR